ncbi:MAG: hypothetical protein AAFX03_00185 [Pseudomonadota bacterium]
MEVERGLAKTVAVLWAAALAACASADPPALVEAEDAKPSPVTTEPWREAMASVPDLDEAARFFREIGGFETVWRGSVSEGDLIDNWDLPDGASGEALVLRAPGREHGLIRLIRFDDAGRKVPTRPGARAWDTGCFFSLMVRAKNMSAIYDDAVAMGWWTETPIADLQFGASTLKIVIFRGPGGMQVQAYERLSPPLPEAFGDFERLSQPFNIMQMVRDREAMRVLAEGVLGFDRFWFGEPYTDPEPTFMPLGIPYNLTTEIPYKAGIFYPVEGEFGRLEAIEINGLEGRDYAERCNAPNFGWLSVAYPVEDAEAAARTILERGWTLETEPARIDRPPYGEVALFRIKTPDGANIEFFSE